MKVSRGFKILRLLRKLLRITEKKVVKRTYGVKFSTTQSIMERFNNEIKLFCKSSYDNCCEMNP